MIHSIQTTKAKHLPSGSWKQLGFVSQSPRLKFRVSPVWSWRRNLPSLPCLWNGNNAPVMLWRWNRYKKKKSRKVFGVWKALITLGLPFWSGSGYLPTTNPVCGYRKYKNSAKPLSLEESFWTQATILCPNPWPFCFLLQQRIDHWLLRQQPRAAVKVTFTALSAWKLGLLGPGLSFWNLPVLGAVTPAAALGLGVAVTAAFSLILLPGSVAIKCQARLLPALHLEHDFEKAQEGTRRYLLCLVLGWPLLGLGFSTEAPSLFLRRKRCL